MLSWGRASTDGTYSQVEARKQPAPQFSSDMLRSCPNTCRGPTRPQQTEGKVLQTRCQHVAGTLGRGGTCQSKLPRRVQEAHRCESHLVFCCSEVTLFLCGHWPVYSCSPGSGRWTFQGPYRAACVLCSHGRCHMSALLPGELEGGIVPLESKVLLQSANPLAVLPQPLPDTLCFPIRACGMVGALYRKPR